MAQSTAQFCIPCGAPNEVRLILLGRTGAGKSSFGNTLLGEEKFDADTCPNAVTKKCAIRSRLFDEKEIFVVDTPGFLDPSVTEKEIREEVANSYEMTATPGPHAFLLVLELTRFLPQEAEAIKYLHKIFGSKAIDHTIIIFTHSDALRKKTIDQYLQELASDAPLRELLNQCKQRFITVNNYGAQSDKDAAVRKLLKMISTLINDNNGEVYRSSDFDTIAKEVAAEKAKGTYNPYKSDGTFAALPHTQKIILDGRLRRTLGRRAIES